MKVQRPGIRTTLAADIALMYSTTRILDWTPRLRGDPQPGGHRRVRALDGGRARLPRRGAPGGPALPERAGRQGRADRPGPSRLHDVARPHHGADRRHPADRHHDRQAGGQHRLSRGARRPRPRPGPDRPQPRLEHAQPGLRVRLLPRRPAPGQPVRPAGRRDRLRRLRDRRPAAGPRPGLPDPLQLAALPGRGRVGRPGADALAGAGPGDGHRDHPLAADPRPPGVPVRHGRRPAADDGGGPGPRAARGEPVLEAGGRHPRHDPRRSS